MENNDRLLDAIILLTDVVKEVLNGVNLGYCNQFVAGIEVNKVAELCRKVNKIKDTLEKLKS